MGTEHISLRIPSDLLAKLKAEALEVERSLNWVIVRKLANVPGAEPGKVSIGPKASGATRAKHQGGNVTVEAEGLGGSNPPICPNKDHRGFKRSDGYWCITCSRMYR